MACGGRVHLQNIPFLDISPVFVIERLWRPARLKGRLSPCQLVGVLVDTESCIKAVDKGMFRGSCRVHRPKGKD